MPPIPVCVVAVAVTRVGIMSVHETATGCGYAWRRASRSSALIGALILALWAAVPQAGAVVIEASSGTLDATGTDTTAVAGGAGESPWEQTNLEATLPKPAPPTPLLDPLPANTSVLVVASFSTVTVNGNGQIGEWQVKTFDATDDSELPTSSYTIHRFMSGSNDNGMVTLVHLFTGLSGRVRFEVFHRTTAADDGERIKTYGGNLAVMPLLTVEEDLLEGNMTREAGPVTSGTGAGNWSDVASVTANLPAPGDIFVAASFTGTPSAANDRGYWRLVEEGGSPIGQPFETLLVNAGQPSAFALFAIGSNLTTTGNHTFKLQHTNAANPMDTGDVSLVAVALSLPDGRRFEAFQATNPAQVSNSLNDGGPSTVATTDFNLAEESDVLVMSQFRASTTGGMFVSFHVGVDGVYSEWGQFRTSSASGDRGGTTAALVLDRAAGPQSSHLQLQVFDSGGTGGGQQARVPANASNLVTILLNTAARPGGEDAIDLYRAYLHTWDNKTILDTCRARSIGEARAAFEARHIGARIVSITHIKNARRHGYELYLGGARTADRRNIKDTCWARNPAQARYIIGDRYPGGIVNHMGLYYTNRRAVTWYGVTQRVDLFDTLVAGSLHEAFLAFSHRFWREHIVQVLQISNENEFHTYEGTLDPEDMSLVLQASSAEKAVAEALAGHPRCQVVSVRSHHAKDGVTTYEALVHAEDGRSLGDTVSARSAAEAQKILRNRYGPGSYSSVEELDWDDGYALFEAGISSAGENSFIDATFAKTAAAADAILKGRYPKRTVGSASPIVALGGYREYQGTINTADGRNVLDTCWADSPAAARKVFAARFADGQVRSASAFGNNRLDAFDVVLKAETTRERCEARDKAEAYRILATRFPKTRIVTVRLLEEVPEQSVFRAALNTPDHRTLVDTVEAKTTSEARQLFLERHPGSRFTSLQRMTEGRVDETYQARVDLPPAKDTCQASSPSEARLIFQARYPRGSTGGLRTILRGG